MIKTLLRELLAPLPAIGVPNFARRILRGPRLFSLMSSVLQLRDYTRQRDILAKFASEDPYFQEVQRYNAGVTQKKIITRTRRMEDLFRILDIPGRDLSKELILHIGPRNIHELLMAWVFGFKWSNIKAIDLYSTNPKIVVMNMESMTFPVEMFDSLIMANTLSYAKDTKKCLEEVVRVLRPGGRAAFGATFVDEQSEFLGDRISGIEILEILRHLPVDLYFYRSEEKLNARGLLQTSHNFGIVKWKPERFKHDAVDLLRS